MVLHTMDRCFPRFSLLHLLLFTMCNIQLNDSIWRTNGTPIVNRYLHDKLVHKRVKQVIQMIMWFSINQRETQSGALPWDGTEFLEVGLGGGVVLHYCWLSSEIFSRLL
jgi:hypothetical protein